MFIVTEADAAAIRATFERDGELSAAIEMRRRFPGLTDNATAREWVRTIAGWKPLPVVPEARSNKPRQVRRPIKPLSLVWAWWQRGRACAFLQVGGEALKAGQCGYDR